MNLFPSYCFLAVALTGACSQPRPLPTTSVGEVAIPATERSTPVASATDAIIAVTPMRSEADQPEPSPQPYRRPPVIDGELVGSDNNAPGDDRSKQTATSTHSGKTPPVVPLEPRGAAQAPFVLPPLPATQNMADTWGQMDSDCPAHFAAQAIASSAVFREVVRIKTREHYVPSGQRLRIIQENQQHRSLQDVQRALDTLSAEEPTFALIYGDAKWSFSEGTPAPTCVWLLGPNSTVASAVVPDDGFTVPSVWAGLNVSTRAIEPRRSDGTCSPFAQHVEEYPLSNKTAALERAADVVIPRAIRAILASSRGGRLIIDPTANFRALPFAAMPLGDGNIVDKFAVIVVPGPATILQPADDAAGGKASSRLNSLVVGDPDLSDDRNYCWRPLPAARDEADYIAERIGNSRKLIGAEATNRSVRRELGNTSEPFTLVYFATHATYSHDNPADEGFLALKGRHLRGADIRGMKLKGAPIVVMSACETGLGKTFGSGMFGLADLWHEAGARQVVMSSWRVSDAGTRDLMRHFVDALERRNWRGAEYALRDAMRELKKVNHDPAVWGAFSVYGNMGQAN